MDTTCNLTRGEKPWDGLAVCTEDAGFGVDLEATHGIVENRGHEGNVEDVVHPPLSGLEELFAEWALLGRDYVVVVLEGLLKLSRSDTHVLGEGSAILIALHKATTNVVLAVPLDLLGSFAVENEPDRMLDTVIN